MPTYQEIASKNDAAALADRRLNFLRACEKVAGQDADKENEADVSCAIELGRGIDLIPRQVKEEIAKIRRAASTQTVRQLIGGFDAEAAARVAWKLHTQQLGIAQSRTRARQNAEFLDERGDASEAFSSIAYIAEASGVPTTPEGGPIPRRITEDKAGIIDGKRVREFIINAETERTAAGLMKAADRRTLKYARHVMSGMKWATRAKLAGGGAAADRLLAEFAAVAKSLDLPRLLADIEARDATFRGVPLML